MRRRRRRWIISRILAVFAVAAITAVFIFHLRARKRIVFIVHPERTSLTETSHRARVVAICALHKHYARKREKASGTERHRLHHRRSAGGVAAGVGEVSPQAGVGEVWNFGSAGPD